MTITLWSQTIYYILTAFWALIDIDSFMKITGPKKDVWLVKTVAVLLISISLSFLVYLYRRNDWLPTAILAVTCCVGLIMIDCFYAFNNIISKIYFADAVIEFILATCWVIIFIQKGKTSFSQTSSIVRLRGIDE